jgi:hypothetical protein
MPAFLGRLRVVAAEVAATEPARLAEVGRTVLGLAVALGWLTLDNAAVNSTATTGALVVSWLLTRLVRKKVVPVTKTITLSDYTIRSDDELPKGD